MFELLLIASGLFFLVLAWIGSPPCVDEWVKNKLHKVNR